MGEQERPKRLRRRDGNVRATLAALLANVGVAISKFVAFAFTGSSAMLAEAAHSVADSGNQVLLLIGRKRATRAPSTEHPFGFGGSRYLYAFVVSVVLFSIGGLFSLYECYRKISDPHPLETWYWAIGVLLVAIALEGFSLRTAVSVSRRGRGNSGWIAYVRKAKAPELLVVLLEDFAALVGLTFALIGVTLTILTSNPLFDALGSGAIGLLLIFVAVVLALEIQSMIIGEAASPEEIDRIEQALCGVPAIQQINDLRTLHLAPDELLVVAKVAVADGGDASEVLRTVTAAEQEIRENATVSATVYVVPEAPAR
ncbi:cation diffusion facilitator family transporter [Flindersiella endophytica]